MDLSALSTLSKTSQNSAHLEARHKKADKLYRLGTEFLKRARKDKYRNRAQLKNAVRCLAASIENNRKDARPYTKLAYVYLLLNNSKKAAQYVNEALRLDSQNSDAQHLQKTIQERAKKSIKNARNNGSGNVSLAQIQQIQTTQSKGQKLAEDVRRQIQAQVQDSYKRVTGIKPTLIPMHLKKLKDLFKQYESNYEYLADKIDQLESEGMDTTNLDLELRKFEINLNLLEDTCKLSDEQMVVKKRILAIKEQLEDHLISLIKEGTPETVQSLEQKLNGYVDQCDELADDLEMFEGSGYDIQPLVKFYEQMNAAFEKFEDSLEQKKKDLGI